MTLYDRLSDLIEGCNRLANDTGIRRRITVCSIPDCVDGPHFTARRIDRVPDSVFESVTIR